MKLRDHYDWIVLGDHPGALLSGLLVARLGLSVLILKSASPELHPYVANGGQLIDFESGFITGLDSQSGEGLLDRCLKAGSKSKESQKSARDGGIKKNPHTAIMTPDLRFELHHEVSELEKSLTHCFGPELLSQTGLLESLRQNQTATQSFWNGLPERLTWETSSQKRSKLLPEPRLRLRSGAASAERAQSTRQGRLWSSPKMQGFEDLSEFSSLLNWSDGLKFLITQEPLSGSSRSTSSVLTDLSLALTAKRYRGGLSQLRGDLLTYARESGAHVPEDTEWLRLFSRSGRIVGVQVSARANLVGATGVVIGVPLREVYPVLVQSERGWIHRAKAPPKPTHLRVSLCMTVRKEGLLPDIADRTIWCEPKSPVLEIEIADPSEYGINEPDHRLVFLRTHVPYDVTELDPRRLRLHTSRMFRQAMEMFPFVEYHVVRIYPDFRSPSNRDFEEMYGYSTLDKVPSKLCAGSSTSVGSSMGIEGIFVATGESYPEWGSLGPTISALESAAWIAHKSAIPGPLTQLS